MFETTCVMCKRLWSCILVRPQSYADKCSDYEPTMYIKRVGSGQKQTTKEVTS